MAHSESNDIQFFLGTYRMSYKASGNSLIATNNIVKIQGHSNTYTTVRKPWPAGLIFEWPAWPCQRPKISINFLDCQREILTNLIWS